MKTLFLVRHGQPSWKDESRPAQASALNPTLRDAGAFAPLNPLAIIAVQTMNAHRAPNR